MTKAIFFPDNKLNAQICSFYNGHSAAVTLDTDTLQLGKYEFAEINLFKYNLQGTVFLSSYYYSEESVLKNLKSTGRLSYGLYFHTDRWMHEGVDAIIPDYYATTWTTEGAALFNVVVGEPKASRFPNHGQQLYDISGGFYGYDLINSITGENELLEFTLSVEKQIKDFIPIERLTSFSYRNGRSLGATLLIPHFLGGRNSSYYVAGDSFIDYSVTREQSINRSGNTRTWDMVQNGTFTTETDGINYAKGEISKAILNNGWWTDFMHWHSLYDSNDLFFFDRFFSAIDIEIGASNVWRAGYSEALEYMFIRDSLNKVGSFENNSKLYLYYEIKDKYKGTFVNGISKNVPISFLKTPISIEIDTTGTYLQGKNIQCNEANSIRSLGMDKWVINVPYLLGKEGYSRFLLSEGTQEYYSSEKPIINNTSGTITTDKSCKFVVWRKPDSSGEETIIEIDRVNIFSSVYNLIIEAGYTYYVGVITKSNNSNLIQI